MDRSKWEYKKLGEVGEIITGGTPPTKDPRNYSSDDYCFVKPSDLTDEKVMMLDDSEYHVSSYAYSNSRKLPKGSVLVCCIGSIGKLGILNVDATCNQQINAIIPKEGFDSRYLAYTLLASKHNLLNIANAPVVPIINKSQFSNIKIKVCPPQDQQRIVAELDCLNEMIALKQEQLKEFDKLAQSIFYDMFGDPVTNEKGWKLSKLGEIGELGRGVSKHRPRNAPELLGGNMPLIQTGDVANAEMYITEYNATYSELGVKQSKIWKAGTLCITIAATIGKCAILSFDACFPDSVVGFSTNEELTNNEYIFYIFMSLQKMLEQNAPAVAQKNINLAVLNALDIPLPPLALQQQFAEKIQAIEAQKEVVKKSIAETQQLLDSRMDYYFD